ncbi:unnamed protein product [Arctia plantaginis]|uniref:Uncharacterized protein n=1 Tax=Arctia plantaginis TaxID=874455 RepID=A0A8S0ZY19_ARCPL|nr:unnamed protein product [Arctia plantaginis]CAB3248395.1 unnamed protein product [Arctia plantaginis]
MERSICFIIVLFVCSVASRHLVLQEQIIVPQSMDRAEVIMENMFDEDSPVSNGGCPPGLQLDISGTCREVWYEDW